MIKIPYDIKGFFPFGRYFAVSFLYGFSFREKAISYREDLVRGEEKEIPCFRCFTANLLPSG